MNPPTGYLFGEKVGSDFARAVNYGLICSQYQRARSERGKAGSESMFRITIAVTDLESGNCHKGEGGG
jgi:hypothetical protein